VAQAGGQAGGGGEEHPISNIQRRSERTRGAGSPLRFEDLRCRFDFDLTGFGGLVILRAASWNKYNGFEKKNVSE